MRSRVKDVSGIDWGDGAVMNAEWTGPLLRDVLVHAGLASTVKQRRQDGRQEDVSEQKDRYQGLHVQMECNATQVQDDEWYGSSVPLDVVMDEEREVVLALEVSFLPGTYLRALAHLFLSVWWRVR